MCGTPKTGIAYFPKAGRASFCTVRTGASGVASSGQALPACALGADASGCKAKRVGFAY